MQNYLNNSYPQGRGGLNLPYLILFSLIALTGLFSTAYAQLPAAEIIAKVDAIRSPQEDYVTTTEITSYSLNRKPKTALYQVMIKGTDNTIIKTLQPETERNRILLLRGHDLWAFFPEVSKPLRLSLQERLMGEVSNGDIARVNFLGDYDAKLLKEELLDGKNCFVLELIAKTEDVTYAKAILWAEVETFHPIKAEFYAVSGKLLKNCFYQNYQILAGCLRPTELVLEDPITKGKNSIIRYNSIELQELPEKYFMKDYPR